MGHQHRRSWVEPISQPWLLLPPLILCATACPPTGQSEPRAGVGEACTKPDDCGERLTCNDGKCISLGAASEAKLDKHYEDIEPEMNKQSLASAPASSTPGAVLIRQTKGSHMSLFAACGPSERLLSGGCKSDSYRIKDSFPESPQPDDTRGGRWYCQYGPHARYGTFENSEQMAYAMCQTMAPAPAAGG